MNRLSPQKRAQILTALVEGNSIRSTCRMIGAAKSTVLRLLEQVGEACADHHDKIVRNVPAKTIQMDEIWSFCGAKSRNIPPREAGYGPWRLVDLGGALSRDQAGAFMVGRATVG